MIEIDMHISNIEQEPDGIVLYGQNGEKVKVKMNEQERDLLRERLKEKV